MSPPASRRDRLRAELAALDADAGLITRLVNVRYLTGLASSNAALLVSADGTDLLATDGRYAPLAAQVADVEVVVDRSVATALIARAVATGQLAVAVETHHVTVDVQTVLREVAPTVRWSSLNRAVERLRTTKDDVEIECLRQACAITDQAFAQVLPALRPGLTERQVARLLEAAMADAGAESPAFETIVATGPHGAVPHHRPTGHRLNVGDLVTMDFGARYQGYHADMTRTVAIGGVPPMHLQDIYALVADAQRAGREAVRPGIDARELDAAARTVIADAGQGPYFPHGLGHGVGLEIHEAPLIGYQATGTIEARTPLTIEPGVYLPGRGGVRIEDTLVVRDGEPELLTQSPRDLLVCD